MHFGTIQFSTISTKKHSIIFSEDELNFNTIHTGLNEDNNIFNLTAREKDYNIEDCLLHSLNKTSFQEVHKKANNIIHKPKKPKTGDKLTKLGKKVKPSKNGDFRNGRWTQAEHLLFIQSIIQFGNEWRKVEKYIGTRSSTQARSHAQKFFEKMKIANLVDKDIDINNKTSIKSLQVTLKHMEDKKLLYTVEDLNGIPFERKKSRKHTKKNKNKANNESIPENFGDLESNTTNISKKSQTLIDKESNDEKENHSISTGETKELKSDEKVQNLVNGLRGNLMVDHNLFLNRKRFRNFSYHSIDITKFNLEIEYSEIENIDFQADEYLIMFDLGKIPEKDFCNYDEFYFENDFNINYECKNGDELYNEFLA